MTIKTNHSISFILIRSDIKFCNPMVNPASNLIYILNVNLNHFFLYYYKFNLVKIFKYIVDVITNFSVDNPKLSLAKIVLKILLEKLF